MSIVSPKITTSLARVYNDKVLNSKTLNKFYKYAGSDMTKFATRMALVSALTKDAVGCYYYVTQSLNNKRIPDDKRNFVASIDLMNGILNVGLQFTIGKWVESHAPKAFSSFMDNILSVENTRKVAKGLTDILDKTHPERKLSMEAIEKFLNKGMLGPSGKAVSTLKVGFSAAVVLVATQIVTKRVLVPFLSTPMASWYKSKVLDKRNKPKEIIPNRMYYQWASLKTKTDGKPCRDKTAFSKMSTVDD